MNQLQVSRIPNVILSPGHGAEALHQLPVVIIVEFVGMAPYIHQIQILPFVQPDKILPEGEQIPVVMAGRLPFQPVLRQGKTAGGLYRPCIFDPEMRKQMFDLCRIRPVRVRHPADRLADQTFKRFAVFHDLLDDILLRAAGHGRMSPRVRTDFVPAVQNRDLLCRNTVPFTKQPRIQVKGALDAKLIKQADQPFIRPSSVVIAHCQCFMPALRIAVINSGHYCYASFTD
ncbi:hypothetical protein D3C75_846020 [compost metagenome]